MADVDKIKKSLRKKRTMWKPTEFLSSGSTMVNLACTGRPDGAFPLGSYCFLVGDSKSGKTFLSLTCLAEASIDKRFAKYRFVYDNAEGGALMDIEKFFGRRVAERVEPPGWDGDEPVYSDTGEEFYYHVDDAIEKGVPFIYVLDSMDSLSSEAEGDKFDERKRAHRAGKEAAGFYTDNKAKVNSSCLRKVIRPLQKSGSILIIINQTRDNLAGGPFGPKKTRSGGHALQFYATLEIWSSVARRLKRTIGGKERQLGVECRIDVKRSRVTGRERSVSVPIFHSSGIDDTGSCVDYLVFEGAWKKNKAGVVEASGLGPTWKGKRENVIHRIEERGMGEDLRLLVGETWDAVEAACAVKREKRYG